MKWTECNGAPWDVMTPTKVQTRAAERSIRQVERPGTPVYTVLEGEGVADGVSADEEGNEKSVKRNVHEQGTSVWSRHGEAHTRCAGRCCVRQTRRWRWGHGCSGCGRRCGG